MKIDNFDNTLVCDEEDFQIILSYFQNSSLVPDYLERAILRIILDKFGIETNNSDDVEELFSFIPEHYIQKFIKDINNMFQQNKKADYFNRHLSYLTFYLSANIFKIWKPLLDLQLRNLLKANIKIMDIGTGPGSVPIGIIEYYRLLAKSFPDILFSLNFTLIDAEEEFIEIAVKVINYSMEIDTPNLKINIEKTKCEILDANSLYEETAKFDMITMSNFLNVNEGKNSQNGTKIINETKKALTDDGSLILIEPGDEISSRTLKKIRNEVVNNNILNVFSPCIGIWEEKDRYDCQCFSMVRCFWVIPKIYEFLISSGLSKGKRMDLPFNYFVLRKDNVKKYELIKNFQNYVKLVDLKQYIGKDVNIKALIRTVVKKGKITKFSICDGSCGFYEDSKAIWLEVSEEQLQNYGLTIPLISAERITLRKIKVTGNNKGEKVILVIDRDTRIEIDY